jgi:hypothetical protein
MQVFNYASTERKPLVLVTENAPCLFVLGPDVSLWPCLRAYLSLFAIHYPTPIQNGRLRLTYFGVPCCLPLLLSESKSL